MENKDVFSVDELITMNTYMLGRGMPTQDDGVGYNKADYGACSNYYDGLSDAQIADLAKRLVKYSETQLHIDKQLMKDTAKYYADKVKGDFDRTDGVSVNVTEDGTLISFRYNEVFIETIKAQPKRQFDGESKQWVVPNEQAIQTLQALAEVGADVKNAIEYVKDHPLIKDSKPSKVEILTSFGENEVFIKFDYNKDVVSEIKKLDKSCRKWNPQHKYWAIRNSHFKALMQALKDIASFKAIRHG